MNITDILNSGRPDKMKALYGDTPAEWPPIPREEYARRYVPSH